MYAWKNVLMRMQRRHFGYKVTRYFSEAQYGLFNALLIMILAL